MKFDNPSYSPDGKWIAMSDGHRNALFLHDLKGKATVADRQLARAAATPTTGRPMGQEARVQATGSRAARSGDAPAAAAVVYDLAGKGR